jgi:hypothetical protein
MATTGSDVRLRDALLLVAEEFEREATLLEGHADEADSPISITRYLNIRAAAHPAPIAGASTDKPGTPPPADPVVPPSPTPNRRTPSRCACQNLAQYLWAEPQPASHSVTLLLPGCCAPHTEEGRPEGRPQYP